MYQDYPKQEVSSFVDFDIQLNSSAGIRRYIAPQALFYLDDFTPFKPLPISQAYPMLEWGMNWCIANNAHHYFMLHAAAVEKNGCGIVMPAEPGSGKSTLTSALVYNGWRLFSDEIALCSLQDGLLYPCTRPINLKNNSIDILKHLIGNSALFSEVAHDTHKGSVALLQPPAQSVREMHTPSTLNYYIFPKYQPGSLGKLTELSAGDAFKKIIHNSFNYHVLGVEAFNLVAQQLNQVKCYELTYSRFEDAFSIFDSLVC